MQDRQKSFCVNLLDNGGGVGILPLDVHVEDTHAVLTRVVLEVMYLLFEVKNCVLLLGHSLFECAHLFLRLLEEILQLLELLLLRLRECVQLVRDLGQHLFQIFLGRHDGGGEVQGAPGNY